MTDPRTLGRQTPGRAYLRDAAQTPSGLIVPAAVTSVRGAVAKGSGLPATEVRNSRSSWLRYLPPAAALGTAAVLQVVGVTDLVGTAIADRMADLYPDLGWTWVWYALAALFGLAVACSLEGSAAYLMDLYDKHLMARDSAWKLRFGMICYVGLSGGLIHWWLSTRGLPELIAWVLAAMSGSALFLWSQGSRWRNRRAMQAAGQIDPALPRLPIGSKLLHPIRSIVTIWLITWGQPVLTVDGARRRYQAWRRHKRVRKAMRRGGQQTLAAEVRQTPRRGLPTNDDVVVPDAIDAATADPDQTGAADSYADLGADREADRELDLDRADATDPDDQPEEPRPRRGFRTRKAGARGLRTTDDDKVLRGLRRTFPDRVPTLNEVQGAARCGRSKAIRLRDLLAEGSDDDKESDQVAV